MIAISKLDKAAVLAALYNNARVQGLGYLKSRPGDMTVEQARQELQRGDDHHNTNLCFDYLHGRVLKVDLSGDAFDPCLYDRDNGDGAAQRAVASIAESGAA